MDDDGSCGLKAEILRIENQVIVDRVFPPSLEIPLDKLAAAAVKAGNLPLRGLLAGLSLLHEPFYPHL